MDSNGCQCLTNVNTRVKVSSTLPGNKAEYGKQNLLDGNNETSWYSNQGKFQYICVFFEESVNVEYIEITFCGGFSPKEMEVGYSESDEFENKTPKLTKVETFVVDNSNNKQVFKLTESINKCKTLRLLMKTFNDLYGRIIVYDLQIKGNTSI